LITPDLTPKEREHNKSLRSQLAELTKNGKKYKIKKQKDSAEEQLSCSACTDNISQITVCGSLPGVESFSLDGIPCLFTNAQSIMNKLPELKAVVDQYGPKIRGIAEMWCSDPIDDSELHLEGCNVFCND